MTAAAKDPTEHWPHAAVLVVDDEPGMVNFLQKALAPRAGQVMTAGTAEDLEPDPCPTQHHDQREDQDYRSALPGGRGGSILVRRGAHVRRTANIRPAGGPCVACAD